MNDDKFVWQAGDLIFADFTNPDSHPFIKECWEMKLADLRDYQKQLVEEFNKAYECAFSTGRESDMADAEKLEERANVADEVLMHREELQDKFGDVAPTDGQFYP